MMTKRQRVEAVLRRQCPDHPPVSFWHHFPADQITGQAAVDAHLRQFESYDLDFLKAMDDHPYPRGNLDLVRSATDLRKVQVLPCDTAGFGDQLRVLSELRRRIGDTYMCTTLFNAWATLRRLVVPPDDHHGPPRLDGVDARDRALSALLKEDPGAVRAVLERIAETLAAFARACVQAGANGIFLSVRDDWVNTPENGPDAYDRLVRATDLQILTAVADAPFNMLHVCGRPQQFLEFARYPIAAINWADRAAGPGIAFARDRIEPVIVAGVDNLNTLPYGRPESVAAEVRDALRQAGDRPIMIAPGCTFDPESVPRANLEAMVTTAKGALAQPPAVS